MSERGPLDFDDESEEEREARWARRRDPDLDQPAGSPDRPVADIPVPRAHGSPYTWLIGVLAVVILGYIGLNTLRTKHLSATGLPAGRPAPPFIAPLATSSFPDDADVNGGKKAFGVPLCAVDRPDVLNLCALYKRKPVALVFVTTQGGCTRELDTVEEVRDSVPSVAFAAVSLKGNRRRLADLVRQHHWGFPVAFDSEGATANFYGIAVCPQLTLIRRGGKVADTAVGQLDARELRRRLRVLTR